MTAAGLYRHCRDKADLFREIVLPSVKKIDDWLETHIVRSIKTMELNEVDLWRESEIDMMRDLIYPNMEEYRLLLTKAQIILIGSLIVLLAICHFLVGGKLLTAKTISRPVR